MLLLTCPYCGPRDEPEFAYGGESHIVRPGLECDDQSWADYLFYRDNKKGVTCERWRHSFGCGCWFNVMRDTASHAIIAVYAMGAARPDNEPRKRGSALRLKRAAQ